MICNMQARLVELKSNKALSVPREKKNEEKNKQLENSKQNLTFRKANLVFESPTAEIIHMPLLSTFQSYNIQTKQNFKSLFTKRKKCRNILVWITIFRYSLPVSQVSMIHNHFIWILYPYSVQVAIGRHLKKFSSKRTLNNNGICYFLIYIYFLAKNLLHGRKMQWKVSNGNRISALQIFITDHCDFLDIILKIN